MLLFIKLMLAMRLFAAEPPSSYLLERAAQAFNDSSFALSRDYSDKYIFYDDKNPSAYYYYNISLAMLGKHQEAINNLNKLITNNKVTLWRLYFIKSIIQNDLKKYKDAINSLNAVLYHKPSFDNAYNEIGNIYETIGDYVKAKENYYLAYKKAPKDEIYLFNLAKICFVLKENDLSQKYLQKLLEINNNNIYALNLLGNIYIWNKEIALAQKTFEKLIEIAPNYEDSYYGLALVKATDNDSSAVCLNLTKAKELGSLKAKSYYYTYCK